MESKQVSKDYAVSEFKTVGLVLILYCLFVLYIPFVLEQIEPLIAENEFFGINVYSLIISFCMIFGTIFPFLILRLASKRKVSDFLGRAHISFKEHFVNFIVFFAVVSASIFITMMLGQYINVSGQLVSSIGITFNDKYMSNIFYVISFVLITPIIEEYAFRGCLLNCLSRYGKYFAIIASSIVYALAHGSFVEMIPAFIMGVVLSKISLRYKSIWPTIFIHIALNLSLYGLSFVPEDYSLYMIIGLAVTYILALVFVVTKTYRFIGIKKSNSNKQVTILFLSTFTVAFSLFLFILHTVLLTIVS